MMALFREFFERPSYNETCIGIVMYNQKLKLRSFKGNEHTYENGDGPCHGFGYISLFSDPVDSATCSQRESL